MKILSPVSQAAAVVRQARLDLLKAALAYAETSGLARAQALCRLGEAAAKLSGAEDRLTTLTDAGKHENKKGKSHGTRTQDQ